MVTIVFVSSAAIKRKRKRGELIGSKNWALLRKMSLDTTRRLVL